MYRQDSKIFEDQHERLHFYEHLIALSNYSQDSQHLTRKISEKTVFNNPFYLELLNKDTQRIAQLIRMNQILFDSMIPFRPEEIKDGITSQLNRSKLMSTIKQFYRQWSQESTEKQLYKDLVRKLKEYMKEGRVLVPGCGLGRLVFELVVEGYAAQGNQVSYFMLLGSDFILNKVGKRKSIEIAPFVHCVDHNIDSSVRLQTVMIPDGLACEDVPENCDFSMVSGDFLEVYGAQHSQWNSVISCFFIDTASNVLKYVDLIWQILKPDGFWINYGPLLYHYHDQPNETSVELSWQALRKYILTKFQLVFETVQETTYCQTPKSMLRSVYTCLYFVAKKIPNQKQQK